jgi:hypothetical protein
MVAAVRNARAAVKAIAFDRSTVARQQNDEQNVGEFDEAACRMTQADRTAVVTGGGSGMGRATALRLARGGRGIAVLDIDAASAASVAAEITAAGGRAIALPADISDRNQVE